MLGLAVPLLIVMTGAVALVFNNFLLAFAIQSTGMLALADGDDRSVRLQPATWV